MKYGYVENGNLVQGPLQLPSSWRNISGLNLMSQESLRAAGWLPWIQVETAGDVFVDSEIKIEVDSIVETLNKRPYTEAEQQVRTEKQAARIRKERNTYLTSCDWTQVNDAPLTSSQIAAWATYRQQLRDITAQPNFPWEVEWPVCP